MIDPHPDEISEAVGVLRYYGGTTGPMGDEAMRRVLLASQAWRERQAAIERAHARRRDRGLDEVRRRASEHLAGRTEK